MTQSGRAPNRGALIAVEGIDGTGKETQSKLLVEALQGRGYSVMHYSFPRYDKPFGKLVRQYLSGDFGPAMALHPKAACLPYACDRQQAASEIRSNLLHGHVVVCDRYTPSNQAHQGAKCESPEQSRELHRWVAMLEYVELDIPCPDRIVHLDMPVQIAQHLIRQKPGYNNDQHESNVAYMQKVATQYRLLADFYMELGHPTRGWKTINCSFDGLNPATVEQIHDEVMTVCAGCLPPL
jgi:dTMP kinase